MQRRSLIKDGVWVASTQVLSALGQLFGIRILTEILPPSVFGELGLWLGAIALIALGLANPTIQALLRFYPEYLKGNQGGVIRRAATRQLLTIILWISPILIALMLIALAYEWVDSMVLFLLIGLILVDIARMQYMALLNAVRAQRAYGVWAVAESWVRPLVAWVAVVKFGVSTDTVLAAFLLATITTLLVMRRYVPRSVSTVITPSPELTNRIWQYTLPLLPLGLLGWVSGMADRYIIGALLTSDDVGLYVAVYGLASRPMLILGSIVETTVRPAYQSSVVQGDYGGANQYLRKWLLLVLLISCIALIVASVGHVWLAQLLLGEPYRGASYLFPWIVGGYALLIISHIPTRICYANGATKRVLAIEASSAVLAVILGYVFINSAGLIGAAIAIPIYFGIQLIISLFLARPWLWKNVQTLSSIVKSKEI